MGVAPRLAPVRAVAFASSFFGSGAAASRPIRCHGAMSLKHPFPVGVWTIVMAGAAAAAQAPPPLFSTGTDLVVLHAT